MIRLAISCDICGAEKKQANHWFVAYEHAGELRISGWKSRHCKRAGSRHLCGQACLHKLVDEFMAKTIAGDREAAAAELSTAEPQSTSAATPAALAEGSGSHIGSAGYEDEYGSSARLISVPAPASEMQPTREAALRLAPAALAPPSAATEQPKYVSHQWRSSAWERERKRESFGR
ncbi:MAG TPA: hypothetical protein VF742_02190 [Terracidiphilus sp.]